MSTTKSKIDLWKSAVGKVLENKRQTVETEPDELGKSIAEKLQDIQFDQVASSTFRWTPLLSRHNVKYIWNKCFQPDTKTRQSTSPPRPSFLNVVMFFVRTLGILFVVTFTFLSIVMVWIFQALYYATLYIFVRLIEVEAIPYLAPTLTRLQVAVNWCDAVVFQGNYYKGREWNSNAPLLTAPPPKRLESLSTSTAAHLDAIDYCYKMLMEEQKRDQERRREKIRQNVSLERLEQHDVTLVTHDRMASSPREEFELQMNGSGLSLTTDPLALGSVDEENNKGNTLMDKELAWIDVGAKIGMRLLHSEHVQRAMASQQTADRFLETIHHHRQPQSPQQQHQNQTTAVSKPVHSMWTSPTADDQGNSETVASPSPQRRSRKLRPRVRRPPLAPGIKIAVPVLPHQPNRSPGTSVRPYHMATVAASNRICVGDDDSNDDSNDAQETNCLSVSVKLEKSFLRNGAFADLTFRIMDDWSSRYMPRHSKVPIGSCVATAYGMGVLVGWRVRDDSHIVRSLWSTSRGAHAYLHRDAIYGTCAAAVGFSVLTARGWGIVVACTRTEARYEHCLYHVSITDVGEYQGKVIEAEGNGIFSCPGAQFRPVIEHVREAALYQIQVDQYNAVVRGQKSQGDQTTEEEKIIHTGSICAEILWNSFLKAIGEDGEFDNGVNAFVSSLSQFLDRLDQKHSDEAANVSHDSDGDSNNCIEQTRTFESGSDEEVEVQLAPESDNDSPENFWIMNDLFDSFFGGNKEESPKSASARDSENEPTAPTKVSGYERAFAVLRTVMKTVSIARASSVDFAHFRLGLAITYDFLLFLRTIVKIQQRNDSVDSLSIWKRAGREIKSTFGPIKERIESIGRGIALRMERQGRMAKVRVLKLFDTLLKDERLVYALEQGEWERCFARLEIALVETEIIEDTKLLYYRKAARFIHDQVRLLIGGDASAATRNSEKLALLGALIQACAAPKRSVLKFFLRNDMLELFERILVRAYHREEIATRMLTIHAANFHSLRHLRMLKDFSVAGRIWIPLLDAADEEFSWLVSKMPEKSKSILCPLSSLFSLCVAQFHRINAGDLSKDWLAFLLEEDSVKIIHDLNMRMILALESFSHDIKEMMMVLPYYPSIDVDILNLMDEINIDEFVQEASGVIDDPEKLSHYVREKGAIAIERFLNYLPKMSIPVERRDLGDGWVLSCHGEGGGGLTLTDVTIKRENVVCQIMGGDTLFFPMFDEAQEDLLTPRGIGSNSNTLIAEENEDSVLHHIRSLLMNAQQEGIWVEGVGGVRQAPTDRYAAAVLQGLPISSVLNCSIDLWRNLEIDDDELLEIAIRDISYHIQLQHRQADETLITGGDSHVKDEQQKERSMSTDLPSSGLQGQPHLSSSSSSETPKRRFNPRMDPTVLNLQIRRLTLNVDNFGFRIEKATRTTVFDPVLEGQGRLSLREISILVRVDCAKEKARKSPLGADVFTPIFQLRDLSVSLEKLQMTVTDTGFGSDWVLNKAVTVFEDKLTEIVEVNLKDQIKEQVLNIIESLNSYFLMNPGLLLNILGVSIEDLDEVAPE